MAEAKKVNPAVTFLANNGEKLALGIAVILLVACAVMWFGMSGEDLTIGLDKSATSLDKESRTAHPEMTAPNTENWQAKAVNPWSTLVTSARPADNWGAFMITKAEGKGVKKEIIKKIPVLVPPVSNLVTEVAIDSITVGWSYKDFTSQEVSKMSRDKDNKADAAKVTHFLLEREVNGSGKWEVLNDKIDAKVLSFVDTKIEPKLKYNYRITAFSADKNFLERGGKPDAESGATANPTGRVNMVTGTPVQTMGIWKISFSNATKPADAAKGMVYVKIEKFEKGVGKVEKAHIHYDGDVIGTWEESAGAEPTSKHRVASKTGRSIEVDFNTGATLISVNPVKLVVDVKRCKPIFDKSTGNKTGCEQIIEKRNFDTAQIMYKDDEGQHKIYVPSPNSLDQLCEEHGGRKSIVTRLDPEKTPEDPNKPDPKEAARLKKEMDAEKLYDDAEKAIEKNKSLALGYYQRLLKDFADTEFVSKNKKAIIEERIAALKKAK
ncbi:MAG TPA: fibronectin type III domain-containing protein [Planctomycetota bacterium]|nr:fibronectin type III domain-containing protein [Planctomycetota bacterium]